MGNIILLSERLKDLIRAGEVIERPSSVLKELIENSIDARSTNISVEIQKGGKRLIAVSDDGEGMGKEDALMSIKRHSTSKLRSEEDLSEIRTMGFRGEALPSIASVCKLRILTAPKGVSPGTSIEAEGGIINDLREAPSEGTTVEVRELFFNTPARRKFLKTETTENAHMIRIITKYALSFPEIGFRLVTDGRESLILPRASGLRERISQAYGPEFLDGLIEARAEGGGMRLKCFFSALGNFRNSKTHQYVFINGRPVKDPSLSHALYGAYEGRAPEGRHPAFFLFLELDPRRLDVNVHPKKESVRFEEKDSVYRFVAGSLKAQLRKKPKGSFSMPEKASPYDSQKTYPEAGPPEDEAFGVSEGPGLSFRAEMPFIYIGETFIAYPEDGGLSLLDHHAAHERVLYEKLLEGPPLSPRPLLFPVRIKLSHMEHAVITKNSAVLREMGLEIEDFGHETVLVRALPDGLEGGDLRGILSDVAHELSLGKEALGAKEAAASKIACHSSIRGKRLLLKEEFMALLEGLGKTKNPSECPHGRPTKIKFSISELKKLFGRK